MLTKWIWDRRLRPVLAGVLGLGLAIGLLASGLPAAQRSARIGEIAAEGLRPLSTLSLSLSRLGGEEIAALRENPADGAEFKTVSGLLTEVRQALGFERILLIAQKDNTAVALADSEYRDTAAAGVTYLAPGTAAELPVSDALKSDLRSLFSGKSTSAYTRQALTAADGESLGLAVPVADGAGGVAAVLIAQVPAQGIDFSRVGFVDLGLVSWLGFLAFAVALAGLVLVAKLRKTHPQPAPFPEPPASPDASGDAPALPPEPRFDSETGKPLPPSDPEDPADN